MSDSLMKCCMKSCNNSYNNNSTLLYFKFPADPIICNQWIEACDKKELENINRSYLHENYYVCIMHFLDNMFLTSNLKELKPTAVPVPNNKQITLHNNIINEEKKINEINKDNINDVSESNIQNNYKYVAEQSSCNKKGIKFSILRNILQDQDSNDQVNTKTDQSNSELNFDFQKICRICLSRGNVKDIENEYFNGISIVEMLRPCINFKSPDEKKLPRKICFNCVTDSKQVYDFIKKCKESKKILENYLEEHDKKYYKVPMSPDDISMYKYDSDNSSDNEPLINKMTRQLGNSNKNQCLKCKQIFKNIIGLNNHKCESKQSKDTIRSIELRRGIKKIEEKSIKEKILTRCARCDIIFPTLEELANHRKEEHAQDRVVVCPVCSKKMSAKAYRSHKEIHCTKLKYCCEYCGRSFSSSSNFNRHMYIHFDMKPHVCEICGRGFRVRAKLTEHRLIHSTERRYMCETCGNSFRQKNVLRAHIQLKRCGKKAGRNGRGPVMKHECSECAEKFYTLKDLRQHRSHTHGTDGKKAEARIYKCEKCEDSFTSTAFLKRHALIHADTKFICSTCNRAFYTLERLQKHESIHDAVKNLICEVCSKAFASKLSLKCHMTVHTGEKKYHCQLCPKTFSQAGQLTSHTRTHTGSRPYQCPYCERAFALNGNLTVHIRTHTGERPYKCKFCEQAFYDSSSAKKHMTVKHGYGAME